MDIEKEWHEVAWMEACEHLGGYKINAKKTLA